MAKHVIEYDFSKPTRPALNEVWHEPPLPPKPDKMDGFWLLLIGGVSGATAASIIAYGLMRVACS